MKSLNQAERDEILARVRHWLEAAVIGLNLCPFAKSVHVKGQIRTVVSSATTEEELRDELRAELEYLRDTPPESVDTTLLVHPFVLGDFLDFNDFLDVADAELERLDLVGEMQIASFHPDYQFAGTEAGDITNYTNRAPYPILHLLREASIARAAESFPDASEIYERNMETMRKLGLEGWQRLMDERESRGETDCGGSR